MTRVVWILHKGEAIVGLVVLAGLAVALVPTGLHMANLYDAALRTCSTSNTCADLPNYLFQGYGLVIDLVLATLAVPLLLALFWGAPLVAKEYEEGTQQLIWTQSVSRRRWLLITVGWVLIATILCSGFTSLLVTWWRSPENSLFGRFAPPVFDIEGIVPVAYAIFAVSLAVFIGVWARRTITAMASTLAIFLTVRVLVFLYVRPRFLSPVHALISLTSTLQLPTNTWVLARVVTDTSGQVVTNGVLGVPLECRNSVFDETLTKCLSLHGYHRLVTYQPANRYWTFQIMESGLFIACALFLLWMAVRLVTKRDA